MHRQQHRPSTPNNTFPELIILLFLKMKMSTPNESNRSLSFLSCSYLYFPSLRLQFDTQEWTGLYVRVIAYPFKGLSYPELP